MAERDTPARGLSRRWFKCSRCGALEHFDVRPFALPSAPLALACGHAGPVDFFAVAIAVAPAEAKRRAVVARASARRSGRNATESGGKFPASS